MNRRDLLTGASVAVFSRYADAQPVPLGGNAGASQALGPGPLSGLGGPPSLDLNFLSGTLDPSITWTRASTATDGLFTDAAGSAYNTFAINAPRMPMGGRGLLVENNVPTFTNILLNSDTPVTQTVTISSGGSSGGQYALWVIGTGSATAAAGTAVGTGFGTATTGVPLVFTATTSGTVVITVNGTLNRFQLERYLYSTSYFPTTVASLSRQGDSGSLPVAAWFNNNEGTLVTDFLTTQGPNGVFADLPALYTDQANLIGQRMTGTPILQAVSWVANAATGVTTNLPFNINSVNRCGMTYNRASNLLMQTVNGLSPVSVLSSALPAIAQLKFGLARGAALDGFIRRVRYWPRAMSLPELQQVTS